MDKKNSFIAGTAKTFASKNVNSACAFYFHQSKIPAKAVEKLQKK